MAGRLFSVLCTYSPLIKFYRKAEALDVDKAEEYQDMVRKIKASKLVKVSIIVDMDDVKKKCRAVCQLPKVESHLMEANRMPIPMTATTKMKTGFVCTSFYLNLLTFVGRTRRTVICQPSTLI